MNKKQNIAAFSIIEAVVGMVVTAVVMGIVFIIFAIISERMLDFKNQNQYIADLNRLSYSINKDIFDSEKMIGQEEGILFHAYSGIKVKYESREEYIIRTQMEFVDTFKISMKKLKFDTLSGPANSNVFQRLEMQLDVNQQAMDLKFFKRVYANDLIKSIRE